MLLHATLRRYCIEDATIDDLDVEAIEVARKNYAIKNPNRSAELAEWDDLKFLNKARITRSGKITRTALLLLGKEESAHLLSPADARITWVLKNSDDSNRDSEHFYPPFIKATPRLAEKIRNTNYQFMRDSTLFPDQVLQYDNWILRELLHNSVAHQDYGMNGRITVVEREDSLTFANPGSFLPGSLKNVVEADSPPDRYRNRHLTQAMVELNMIDTLGSGIPKTFKIQRDRGFPMPDYEFDDGQRVTVKLTGRVLDENYTRALLSKTDLSLGDVIALDKVQKKHKLSGAEFKSLKEKAYIEGRRPNIYVSAKIAEAVGKKSEYVLTAGFDDAYYKDLILKLIEQFGEASPSEIQNTLMTKLPDVFSEKQKRDKIRNLIQGLSRAGEIENVGTRGRGAKWARVQQNR